jgi:hypothetical protein
MNDERLERQIRAALERDARPLPPALRARLSAIPDEFPRERRAPRFAQFVAAAGAVAAVLVLAVVTLVLVGLHNTTIGPAATSSPSAPATAPAVVAPASPSTAPSATATPSVVARVSGPWSGLRWSGPAAFPSPMGVDGVVAFGGQLYAIGQVRAGSGVETVVWRSSDGTTWTKLVQGGATFAGSGVLSLLATPSGLIAWGQDGEPVCSAPRAGQTCGPVPQMVWTSADGFTWTKAPDVSAIAGATIQNITSGPAGLVAAGSDRSGAPAVWTSATGATWSRANLPSSLFPGAAISDVRATTTGYVLAGAVNVTSPPATGGGVVVGVQGTAAAWWSSDGRSWVRANVQRQNGLGTSLGQIFVGAQGLVAVGTASAESKTGTAWSSTDGRSWTPMAAGYAGAPSPAPGEPVLKSFSIQDDGTHLVATAMIGQTMQWWSSTDGATWRPLVLAGDTDTSPLGSRENTEAARWFDHAFVVPGGVVVVATGNGSPDAPGRVWVAEAEVPLGSAAPGACQASQLRVHGGRMGGGTGTVQADAYLTNVGTSPCTLGGDPAAIELLRADGSVLATVAATPAATPGPPVTLSPGVTDAANLAINWSNWCGGAPGPLRIRMTLPEGMGAVTGDINGPPLAAVVPRCDHPEWTSALELLWSFSATP